jgi:Zn-finger nucleic acid-binding protein
MIILPLPRTCPICKTEMKIETKNCVQRTHCKNPRCGYWIDQMNRYGKEPIVDINDKE